MRVIVYLANLKALATSSLTSLIRLRYGKNLSNSMTLKVTRRRRRKN